MKPMDENNSKLKCIAGKWNYETKAYDPYSVPESWHTVQYSEDANAFVNCACCGKLLPYGKTYSSMEIHDEFGFGFSVCCACHEAELKRRLKEAE